jgi:hypothetical protein
MNQLTYKHRQVRGDNGVFPYVNYHRWTMASFVVHVDLKGVTISHPSGSL